METFYSGWGIVQAVINSNALMPKEVMLPHPMDRQVAKLLVDRRSYPVIDVIDALKIYAQPHLIETNDKTVDSQPIEGDVATNTLITPLSRPF
jgi:hypothetical protein